MKKLLTLAIFCLSMQMLFCQTAMAASSNTGKDKGKPAGYTLKLLNDNYVLKYARQQTSNYYLKQDEKLGNYTNLIRINQNIGAEPEIVAGFILEDQQEYKGYKLLRKEKSGNAIYISYITDIINLRQNKKYKVLSIYKITSNKGKSNTFEILERIPEDEPNMDSKIIQAETTYYEYLRNNKLPVFVNINFGNLPVFNEEEFAQIR